MGFSYTHHTVYDITGVHKPHCALIYEETGTIENQFHSALIHKLTHRTNVNILHENR